MGIFIELDSNNENEFFNKLSYDLMTISDGEYIYAFLNDSEFGVFGDYTKLKVVKYDGEFTGFITKKVNKENDYSIVMVDTKIFKLYNRDDYGNGYCLSENDAIVVKLLRIKENIDNYCASLGIGPLDAFLKKIAEIKDTFPEKLI